MAAAESIKLARGIVIGLGALALTYFLFKPLSHYFAVLFCAILLALALGTAAGFIHRATRMPRIVALLLVVLLLLGAMSGLVAWLGPMIVAQFDQLKEAVPQAIAEVSQWLKGSAVGREVQEEMVQATTTIEEEGMGLAGNVGRGLVMGADMIADLLILAVIGFFLAATPDRYARGLLLLVPRDHRGRIREVIDAAGRGLQSWLMARLALMVFVGVSFGLGLWIADVPLALPLAVLAGTLSFIPWVGPLLALIPALAVGFLEGPQTALYVLIVYGVVQLLDGNLVEPLVESRAVSLPPALIVLAQVISAVWFGFLGVLIATPLLVVIVIAVQLLYVRDHLGETVEVVGSVERPRPRRLRRLRTRDAQTGHISEAPEAPPMEAASPSGPHHAV